MTEKSAIPAPPQIRDFATAITAYNHLWALFHEHMAAHAVAVAERNIAENAAAVAANPDAGLQTPTAGEELSEAKTMLGL